MATRCLCAHTRRGQPPPCLSAARPHPPSPHRHITTARSAQPHSHHSQRHGPRTRRIPSSPAIQHNRSILAKHRCQRPDRSCLSRHTHNHTPSPHPSSPSACSRCPGPILATHSRIRGPVCGECSGGCNEAGSDSAAASAIRG
jgi:hypothetical protein